MNRLLAKTNEQASCFLTEHTSDVVKCTEKLISIYPFLNKDVLKISALFHDLGKACSGFQNMLSPPFPMWGFRHEVISTAILLLYLRAKNILDLDDDKLQIALSVLTHHKNIGNYTTINSAFISCMNITQFSQWNDKWQELNVTQLQNEFSAMIPEFPAINVFQIVASPANEAARLLDKISTIWSNDTLAFSRAALVAADHLASSGKTSILFGENITRESIENYATTKIKTWQNWSDIQTLASVTDGSAMLIAPTGAGKTEAALLWATNNRRKYERIFYVLPYQVSINAMASRLSEVFPDENGDVSLNSNETISIKHSNTDLAYIQDALNDELSHDEALKIAKAAKDRAGKIYSPIKVTTIYQLLNIFFGQKFFEVGILELKDSLLIFDEIHAYDGHTLGLIMVMLKYLQKLNARCFIMTATLPNELKRLLQESSNIAKENIIKLPENDYLCNEVRRTLEMQEQCIV